MNGEWPVVSLREVIIFLNNKRIPLSSMQREKRKGQYPYYGASGIVDYIDDYIFNGTYLLISEDGENLRTRKTPIAFQVSGKFWVNNHAHIIMGRDDETLDYIEFYFENLDINAFLTGAVQPKLSKGILEQIPIAFPPYEVRKEINKVGNSLTKKIALNRQINQTLEAMAQALFKSWFVDFEPVRAKIAALEIGEDPTQAAMRTISGKTDDELADWQTTNPDDYAQLHATASLFPEALTESELGLVPEGWEVSEIGDEVDVVGGGTPSTSNPEFWEEGNIAWTSPKDLSGLTEKILLSTASKITSAGLRKISSGLLPINTVLMSSRAPVGYLALAKIPVAINQGYIAMKCTKLLSPEYVIQWSISVMDEIKQRASGSTFAEISKTSFRPIKVIVPSFGVVRKYTNETARFYEMITGKARESQNLAVLRDTLLPKLLSGSFKF